MRAIIRIPARGRIGKRGGQYALYLDKDSSELLRDRRVGLLANNTNVEAVVNVITNKYPNGLRFKARLTVDKSYKPPRVTIWLPKSFNPIWEEHYNEDEEVVVTIEIQQQ